MMPQLGIIEGFYGRPWTWEARKSYGEFMKRYGFCAYIYAPKADIYMRKLWYKALPEDLMRHLAALSLHFHSFGLKFGIGLSPHEIYLKPFGLATKDKLAFRIQAFEQLGLDILCVLMDDMTGKTERLAQKQIEILNFISANTSIKQIIFCPTYYSDDPALERLYGAVPANYFSELKAGLDKKIDIFWTGNKVCSKSFTFEYLKTIAFKLGRKPVIWDNYPVNDGPKMSQFLHLNPFTERYNISSSAAAHFSNPMNQAELSKIVLLTLAESYKLGSAYLPKAAFKKAAKALIGKSMTILLERDLKLFSEIGLSGISCEQKSRLIHDYSPFLLSSRTKNAASEIIAWLNGRYAITEKEVLAQASL